MSKKNNISLVTLACVLTLMSGCSIDGLTSSLSEIKDDTLEKVENVKNEVDRVTNKVKETTDFVKDKYEKGKKVVDAIEEFTGDASYAADSMSEAGVE